MQQLKRLKNKSNLVSPQLSLLSIIERRRRCTVDEHNAVAGKIHRSSKMQEGRFAATAAAHQADERSPFGIQGKLPQRMNGLSVRLVALADILKREDRHEPGKLFVSVPLGPDDLKRCRQ